MSGWSFPIRIDENTGKIKTTTYERDIKESIYIILTTNIGERLGNPQFGSKVFEYMFEPINDSLISDIEIDVKKAIEKWEKRIDEINVSTSVDDASQGIVSINIKYTIKAKEKEDTIQLQISTQDGRLKEVGGVLDVQQ